MLTHLRSVLINFVRLQMIMDRRMLKTKQLGNLQLRRRRPTINFGAAINKLRELICKHFLSVDLKKLMRSQMFQVTSKQLMHALPLKRMLN